MRTRSASEFEPRIRKLVAGVSAQAVRTRREFGHLFVTAFLATLVACSARLPANKPGRLANCVHLARVDFGRVPLDFDFTSAGSMETGVSPSKPSCVALDGCTFVGPDGVRYILTGGVVLNKVLLGGGAQWPLSLSPGMNEPEVRERLSQLGIRSGTGLPEVVHVGLCEPESGELFVRFDTAGRARSLELRSMV